MIYDILIIGAGPAGLTAAIYARRAGKSVLVLEKDSFGGQITFSPKLENYPGFETISGNELAQRMLEQALALGANVDMDTVTGIENGSVKTVIGENARYEARAVIIAAGLAWLITFLLLCRQLNRDDLSLPRKARTLILFCLGAGLALLGCGLLERLALR